MYKLGIDIGGTKINTGIFTEEKELVISRKTLVSDIRDIYAHIKETVMAMCLEKGIAYDDILSCGVGIPGTVDESGKKALKVPNMDLIEVDFADTLSGHLNIPVKLIQDSRAAAWGEYLCGWGTGKKTVVCITLGTGIGTGIVINGEIYNGALGCAGELGHIPIVEEGRECGCGKKGCLEKYAAGVGLDITAKELLGADKSSEDLFEEAKKGNPDADYELKKTAQLLGNTLVSVVNLLSPDCLVFSGGLSMQEEFYLNPVIENIKNSCYLTRELPLIKKSRLGENAPLYGAAFIPGAEKRKAEISASLMCADMLEMRKALAEISDAGIDYIHCDIMDNHFVPNMMLSTEFLNTVRSATNIPFDIHIMAENPDSIIEKLLIKEGDIISTHYESVVHLNKTLMLIKEKGAKAAVALNPSTPVEMISEVLDYIDMVLLMTVNPGFSGQKMVPSSFDKIKRMREFLDKKGYSNIKIEVDGNCSFENVPKMYDAGAEIFVAGTSSVFTKEMTVKAATEKLLSLIKER